MADQWHGFGQALIIVPPGLAPVDALEVEAASEANLAGEESTLSWATGAPTGRRVPSASIELFNVKARAKPFLIFSPSTGGAGWEGNGLPWPFCFFHWDHWPAEQIPSDGRQTFVIDGRPAHTSIDNPEFRISATRDSRPGATYTFTALIGMAVGKTAGQLAPLGRSWLTPPPLQVASNGFASGGYILGERCYLLRRERRDSDLLECTIQASPQSPLINPALRIMDWDTSDIELSLDGQKMEPGKDFRFDRRDAAANTDLIVWIQRNIDRPVACSIHGR